MPSGLTRFLAKGLMLAFGGLIEIDEPERLASLPEPVVFALNHNNSFEAVLVPTALMWHRRGRPVHFFADWMYLHLPIAGRLLRQAAVIPVYGKRSRWSLLEDLRHERIRSAPPLETALGRLASGASLGIFPEGTRNADPERLRRGRSGLGELVLRSAAPVVPVGIRYPAAARLGRAPRIGRMTLKIGEPLGFEAERQTAPSLAPRDRHALARRIVHQTMAELAALSGKVISHPGPAAPAALSEPAF